MAPEMDWMRERLAAEVEKRNFEGKTSSNLKTALKPVQILVRMTFTPLRLMVTLIFIHEGSENL